MEGLNVKKDKNLFIYLLILLFFILCITTAILILIIQNSSLILYKIIIKSIIFLTALTSIYIFNIVFLIYRIINNKKIPHSLFKFVETSIKTIYPTMIMISNILNIDKNPIRRVFSEINNKIVISKGLELDPRDILIIAPHCLQKSFCKHKITGAIDNCKRCGACNINDLINICEKYNVNLEIVTGGTLARKLILDYKPKGIIAIACERDLSHGILDVKSIPVIGVTNIRPEGPCNNTSVDIQKVEKAICFFTGGI